MSVNFEAIEKAWFKPKKTILDELEEWAKTCKKYSSIMEYPDEFIKVEDILDKIQELKKENENVRKRI